MDEFGSSRNNDRKEPPTDPRAAKREQLGDYDRGLYNEYSYEPPRKKSDSGKGFSAALAVLCICAIGISSVVGISLLRDASADDKTEISTSAPAPQENTAKTMPSSTSENAADNSSVVEETGEVKDLPTIYTQAAPADAMSIPDIVSKLSPSVVGISCITGNKQVSGTGIIMSADGYVITNAHVVKGASAMSVVVTDDTVDKQPEEDDGEKSVAEKILESQGQANSTNDSIISAKLIGIDEQTDLAVLKITKDGLKEAEFGSSGNIQVGELAIVIGNPLGFDLANTVTSGIISAKNRSLTIEDRTMNLIQTDASINSGNSGGPLINAYGQVIGITSAKVSSQYGEGLGFAIPIDEAKVIIDDLIRYGYVKGRPTLGISGENINAFYAEYYGVPQGFIVRSMDSGSAAERAGIQLNDIIVGIQGDIVKTMEEFNKIKEQYKAGDTITVSVYRGKGMGIKNIEVTLDEVTDSSASTDGSYPNYDEFFNNFPF